MNRRWGCLRYREQATGDRQMLDTCRWIIVPLASVIEIRKNFKYNIKTHQEEK